MRTNRAAEYVEKSRQVQEAIEGALKKIEAHAGEIGFRHLYDKALHIRVSIKEAGFSIVRKRSEKSAV